LIMCDVNKERIKLCKLGIIEKRNEYEDEIDSFKEFKIMM